MSVRYRKPRTPLAEARHELKMLRAERAEWMKPHPWGERYDAAIFDAKRQAYLKQHDPLIAFARAEVKRLEAECNHAGA